MDSKSENNPQDQTNQPLEKGASDYLTTDQGVPVANNQDQLTAGPRGGSLLEDFIFREKMTHFDHERVPERVVHARGTTFLGEFESYQDLSGITRAKFLSAKGKRTAVAVRWSTVVGSRGSADTVRDVRGFATKFYTEEGNFDLVGNNIPVFFIQDAQKFPDLVHSIKPEPHHEMPQASAAHDNFWDFISLTPESMHMILWVLSDRALPRSYATMEGFGVHTFRLVNEEGASHFVKWHWKPLEGVHSLVFDEAQTLAGKDPDFNRRDIWERIEAGAYPEFELGIQIVTEEQASTFSFDILDPTKLIPEELVPVTRIGKMTLNRNVDNFFAESEQIAFHPGHIVPGIDFTNDPLLQGRLFSYLDTQINRFGTANFAEVPINQPRCPVFNNNQDGFARHTRMRRSVNYEPNSLNEGKPREAPHGFVSFPETVTGLKVRSRPESFNDHFSQATLFWNSMSGIEKEHIVEALHFELGKVEHVHIRQRICDLLYHVAPDLANRAAAGIGIETVSGEISYLESSSSPRPGPIRSAPTASSSLSQAGQPATMKGRIVAILVTDGTDSLQVDTVKQFVENQGARCKVVSTELGSAQSQSGDKIPIDMSFRTAASVMFDGVVIPSGQNSSRALSEVGKAIRFVQEAFVHGKPIAAFGQGARVLESAQLPDTGLPTGSVEGIYESNGVVVAENADQEALNEFLAAMKKHRHFDRSKKDSVPS